MDSPDSIKQKENTKYAITDITHPNFVDLHRIVALRSIGKDVKAGDLGGYVQSESNLSFDEGDDAWIYDDAIVGGSAYVGENSDVRHHAVVANFAVVKGASVVCGNAIVKDNAIVRGILMGNHAVAKGSAYVSVLDGTRKSPVLRENCEVSGTVQGDVTVGARTVIEPGEQIINVTKGEWVLTERNHKQKEPMTPHRKQKWKPRSSAR